MGIDYNDKTNIAIDGNYPVRESPVISGYCDDISMDDLKEINEELQDKLNRINYGATKFITALRENKWVKSNILK